MRDIQTINPPKKILRREHFRKHSFRLQKMTVPCEQDSASVVLGTRELESIFTVFNSHFCCCLPLGLCHR